MTEAAIIPRRSDEGSNGRIRKIGQIHKLFTKRERFWNAPVPLTERRTGILVSGRQENTAAGISFFGGISLCILIQLQRDEIGIEIDLDQKVETIADLDQFIQSKKG